MNVSVLSESDGAPSDLLLTANVKQERRSRSVSSTRSKSQLPHGVGDTPEDKRWTEVFVPTFLSHLGASGEPWNPTTTDTIAALQAIWNVVYHDKPHRIESSADTVYKIVCPSPLLDLIY